MKKQNTASKLIVVVLILQLFYTALSCNSTSFTISSDTIPPSNCLDRMYGA